jgi:hypothetical protein
MSSAVRESNRRLYDEEKHEWKHERTTGGEGRSGGGLTVLTLR